MTAREVLRVIHERGGEVLRQKGSHIRVRAGACYTTVPDHGSGDLPPGTLGAIERDLAPCLGKGWLRRR
jgi:predicted RNA binding protein YcfA (HicA-like mRNA interferase family)